jgi:hypothetical protein
VSAVPNQLRKQFTIIGLREVQFDRRHHPGEGEGWCSCCRDEATDGVMVTRKNCPMPFHFLCIRCARAIAAVST